MKQVKLFLTAIALFAGISHAAAAELVIIGASSNMVTTTREDAIAAAISNATKRGEGMIQKSPWITDAGQAGSQGRWFGTARASFYDPKESSPWFINLEGKFEKSDYISNQEEVLRQRMMKSAKTYCNSKAIEVVSWDRKDGERKTVHITGRFECIH